jgi:hypothetical protein
MVEVAGLMKLGRGGIDDRRRYVRRLIRRLEERDRAVYLRRFGSGKGKLYVAVSALEQLMPWDPGTLTAVRGDVDGLGIRMKRAERKIEAHDGRLSGHDRDLAKLRAVQEKAAAFAQSVGELLGQNGPETGHGSPLILKGTRDRRQPISAPPGPPNAVG